MNSAVPAPVREQLGPTAAFRAARDLLLRHRTDLAAAHREFAWPRLDTFNWALDWFDVVAADPRRGGRPALRVLRPARAGTVTETVLTFAELATRSAQVAGWLRDRGVRRGDVLLVMLGQQPALWEILLAAMKLGAVVVPAPVQLGRADLADRLDRGGVRHVLASAADTAKFDGLPGLATRVAVAPAGRPAAGWLDYADSHAAPEHFTPEGPTAATDPLLRYFTSGTSAAPKLVEHTHASFPVGQLSTLYTVGLQPGDVHLNVSSPGWAKHACSTVFAPWSAEACVLVVDQPRFATGPVLDALRHAAVTTFCAPPTVWRMLVREGLGPAPVCLREAVAAGEPLEPALFDRVQREWGLPVRDAYGQTEATGLVGNPPGQPVRPGSMGRPLPGYRVELVDTDTGRPAERGEICLDVTDHPLGLTVGYHDRRGTTPPARNHRYHTGDLGRRDEDGYLTFLGRRDELFKASDHRVSPSEIERVLLEHDAVAEVVVTPFPHPIRLTVPKAHVRLAPGWEPTSGTARAIFDHSRHRLAPYQRVRRVEFADLPRTPTGKVRRAELRNHDSDRLPDSRRRDEYAEDDLPESADTEE